MANITLFVSDELKEQMNLHKNVRWSRTIREIIEESLADFKEAERLARKSRLTPADVELLSSKVDRSMARHAEGLLHEDSGRR